jgi:hypothetical protein
MTKHETTIARPLLLDNWRSRWVQFLGGARLHRLSRAAWDAPDEMVAGHGLAVCGRRGRMSMPGIFSRMDAQRCPACCRALCIPNGNGAPFNALEGDAKHV